MRVVYLPIVLEKDLVGIPQKSLLRIKDAIEKKLIVNEGQYSKPLVGIFRGFYKLKVGNYRIVYKIEDKKIIIIVIISHRKDVYKKLERR